MHGTGTSIVSPYYFPVLGNTGSSQKQLDLKTERIRVQYPCYIAISSHTELIEIELPCVESLCLKLKGWLKGWLPGCSFLLSFKIVLRHVPLEGSHLCPVKPLAFSIHFTIPSQTARASKLLTTSKNFPVLDLVVRCPGRIVSECV